MTAPTQQLPPATEIAKLPKRSQMAYAIRCALRVEPLYADKDPSVLRAHFVRACIDTAQEYFDTGRFEDKLESLNSDQTFSDHGASAAFFAREAAYAAHCEETDPDYDAEEAEYDEATLAHRVECVSTFSLLAVYHTSGPLEDSRRCERLALARTLADFAWLLENQKNVQLDAMGPLWELDMMETYQTRLQKHAALVSSPLP